MKAKSSFIITWFLSTSLGASALASSVTSFYDFSPPKTTVQGVTYPQNDRLLYRGLDNNQMDLSMAIRALFGDTTANVESFFFSTIKHRLMKKSFSRDTGLSSYLESKIDELLQKAPQGLSASAAVAETKKLVDQTFVHLANKNQAIPLYVDYRSGSYIDWPKEVVFTTVLSPLSGTYGDKTVVIRETKPRSIDLNYWNQVKNGIPYDHTRDIGEFVAFGYIPSEHIIGYQVREGRAQGWHSIQVAFYQSVKNKNAILVFSGDRKTGRLSTCIDFKSSEQAYYHCEFRPGTIIKSQPPMSDEKPRLLGVIVSCDNDKSCTSASPEEVKKYESVSNSPLIAELESTLSTIRIPGKTLKLIKTDNLGEAR